MTGLVVRLHCEGVRRRSDFVEGTGVMLSRKMMGLNTTTILLACRRGLATAVLAGLAVGSVPNALAQSATTGPQGAARQNSLRPGEQYASQQIPQTGAQPVKKVKPTPVIKQAGTASPRPKAEPAEQPLASLVRQAAHGYIVEESDPVPLGSIRQSRVVQASHGCGCDHCSSGGTFGEVGCGMEPTCGMGGGCGVAGCCDSGCGFEASCGIEPGCGVQTQGCGGYGCDGGSCGDCVDVCLPVLRIDWRRYEFFAGVNGFTGPQNHATDATGRRGGSGSFGFYEGFNRGHSLNRLLGLDLASQIGMRATQSSLSGAEFTEDSRNQVFVTGGLFRRVDFGLQYGLVVDYQYDDWWYRTDLMQLRGELSWNDNCGHEFGYQFMAGTTDSTSRTTLIDANNVIRSGTVTFEPTNQHRLFFRGATAGGGSYQAFAGGTDRGDGLLGGTVTSAFRNRFAVQGGVTYLIPAESNRAGGFENEAWSLSMGVVFRPGGKNGAGRYCRPMFDVADNGTFLVDRK
jgi:hypothetical protein